MSKESQAVLNALIDKCTGTEWRRSQGERPRWERCCHEPRNARGQQELPRAMCNEVYNEAWRLCGADPV